MNFREKRTLKLILDEICKHYKVSKSKVERSGRYKNIVSARRAFCYVSSEVTNSSFSKIGRMCKIDHSTVSHHIKTASERMEVYGYYREEMEFLVESCQQEMIKYSSQNQYLSAMNNLGQAYLLGIEITL